MNGMVYFRGNRKDYNDWQDMGNPGWSFEEVLPYFKKSEDLRALQVLEIDHGQYHSTGGRLKVDNFFDELPLKNIFLKAAEELGYENLTDTNASKYIGFGLVQGTIDKGTRCSTAKAFLTNTTNNLHVVKHSMVTEIILNDRKQAVAVKFIRKGQVYEARCTKEIIVSCGTINSPQLLMLSGIGPTEHLEEIGITTKIDLPVGKHLEDHMFIPTWIKLNQHTSKGVSREEFLDQIYQMFLHHDGPLSGIGLTNIVGFINTLDEKELYPNTQIHFVYFPKNDTQSLPVVTKVLGFLEETRTSIIKANLETDIIMIMPNILNPLSNGEIKLKSKDPLDKPLIIPNYFYESQDMEVGLNAIHFFENFLRTKNMKDIQAEFIKLDLPNCRHTEYFTDDFWECMIRNIGTSEYHITGTVKMGSVYDSTSVVDARLKVHGIRGLRVIDASIMPKITSSNTNAPTIMIGEKGADMIKHDWSYYNK